jgi:rhomboid protease GluP
LRRWGTDLGFVPLVIGGSSVLYVLSLISSGPALTPMAGPGSILAPSQRALIVFGASGQYPVFLLGSWWTVLSATWLHGNLLHILFNMMWVRSLGPAMADIAGPGRTVVIYVVSGAFGFLVSTLAGSPLTVGASASIFGLLGALVHYGRRSGSSLVYGEAMRYAVILFIFGFISPSVDNFAHAGGFVGGYLSSAFFSPLSRERGDHLLMAAICLAASFLAVIASVIKGLSLVG